MSKPIPESLLPYKEFLESAYEPCNELVFIPGETKPWESKLGGCPYLEKETDYPVGQNGRPMMFFAQINLEEMPPLAGIPAKGLLQFYVNNDDCYGYDGPCSVRYLPEYHQDEAILLKANPFRDKYEGYEPFEREGKMTFVPTQMPRNTASSEFYKKFGHSDLPAGVSDDLFDFCFSEGCRVGGPAFFVQNPPEYYEDGSCDFLLLQLDVEEECGIMFGDCGSCAFLISSKDLKSLDFSHVEYEWQCY